MSRFDRDTAITPSDGGFDVNIDRGWWILVGPNGGYLAAMLLRGALEVAGDDRLPIALTTHYLRPPAEGPAFLEAEIIRRGRSVTSVMTRLSQEGRLIAFATAALTAPRSGVMEFCDLAPPAVPKPGECQPWPGQTTEMQIPIAERYETRWAVGDVPFSGSERAESGGWIRTEDARGIDALLLTALTDAWVPALFTRLTEPSSVAVPTVELSIYFRDASPRPPGEWALVTFRSQVAAGGYLEEDGEIWSQDGALLAQSRQLALLRPS